MYTCILFPIEIVSSSFIIDSYPLRLPYSCSLTANSGFRFDADEINAMDMVSTSCTVNKGDLPIKITWMHNNQLIYSNDGVSISRTNQRISIVSIESVRDRHSGNYTCIAENSGGSVNLHDIVMG